MDPGGCLIGDQHIKRTASTPLTPTTFSASSTTITLLSRAIGCDQDKAIRYRFLDLAPLFLPILGDLVDVGWTREMPELGKHWRTTGG